MITKHLHRIIYNCSNIKQPFLDFLAQKEAYLQAKKGTTRAARGLDIYVSRKTISREQATQFMTQRDIKNKNVLINIDASHLMGIKRIVARQFFAKNVYKGKGEPVDILTKANPSQFVSLDEISFNEQYFIGTDPTYLEKAKTDLPQQQIYKQVAALYSQDLERGGRRLFSEYAVPPEYIPIVEAAHNLQNKIFFVGLNEFDLRRMMSLYFTLSETKAFFMEALKYVEESRESEEDITKYFKFRCKEYLWREHYSFLQPINYQQMQAFKRSIKGYCFAHPYNFIKPENPPINFGELKDKESDSNKIEKNAILSVLFGNIWGQSYANNPFPYLAQDYLRLSAQDQQTVTDLYNTFYNRYYGAKNKFYEQKGIQMSGK